MLVVAVARVATIFFFFLQKYWNYRKIAHKQKLATFLGGGKCHQFGAPDVIFYSCQTEIVQRVRTGRWKLKVNVSDFYSLEKNNSNHQFDFFCTLWRHRYVITGISMENCYIVTQTWFHLSFNLRTANLPTVKELHENRIIRKVKIELFWENSAGFLFVGKSNILNY